jgi:tRNA(Ile)-lysidine synthase
MAVQPAVDVLSPWRARLVGLEGIEPPVVVGCSGGPDSLALLTLVVDRGLAPVAVHVDHGLRPGSAAEVGAVAARAASLGADFAAATIRIEPGSNLEARAREGRYRALEEVRDARGASAVLVGHTADDQA